MKNCFSGALKVPIFDTFWNKIRQILGGFCHLGSCIPKEVSRYPHNYCRMTFLSLFVLNMDSSWLQLASSWVHAGPKLVPTWLKLGPCWTHFRVSSHPWANPSPSKPFPCGLWASQNPSCALQDSTYHAGWYSPACRPCLLTLLPSLHYKIHMCINTYICIVFGAIQF